MSSKSDIARSASVVSIMTLSSRVLGLIRDISFAYFFGAITSADAFFVAYRIPNLLRRLVAEGAMSSAFVPVFTQYHAKYGDKEAKKVSDITFTYLLMVLLVLSILGIIFSKELVYLFAPGFELHPEKFHLTVTLNKIMFPFILLVSIVALCMGILNSLGYFFIPALSPIILNIFMITFILIANHGKNAILIVAIGVIVGGLMELVPQLILMHKKGFMFSLNFNYKHPALKESVMLFLPMMFGAAVYQLNVFMSNVLASFLKTGSISYLYYASRLFEFPQGIFAVSIAIAALPTMSRDIAMNNIGRLKESMTFALKLLNLVTIPATFGLIFLARPIISVLFHRGSFSSSDTIAVAYALIFYAIGLWPVAFSRVITQAFYALKDAKTPVLIAFFSVIINLLLSVWLMNKMEYRGLALATSLSAYFNAFYLLYALRRKIGKIGLKNILVSFLKAFSASIIMCIILILGFKNIMLLSYHYSVLRLTSLLISAIALGVVSYMLISYILKTQELKEGLDIIIRKLR